MIELSKERVAQILHEETLPTEALPLILRSIYSRYLRLFEEYFQDMYDLDDAKIAKMKQYYDETKTLVKYYCMDIPMDVCKSLWEFDHKVAGLFGPEWKRYIYEGYDEFCDNYEGDAEGDDDLRALFKEKLLETFYDEMGEVFREGFGTESKSHQTMVKGFTNMLFGKKD